MGVYRSSHRTVNFLSRSFFERDPVTCARELVGCELVWKNCAGIIVETEAYSALNDEACHTFVRPSARTFLATRQPATTYVYLNYGVHWLLNFLVKGKIEEGFVLIRALEPTQGLDVMRKRREKLSALRGNRICSGPGKLTQALGVTASDHGRDICGESAIGIQPRLVPVRIVSDARIGISRAAHYSWRFLLEGSSFISVKPSFPDRSAVDRG